MRNVGQLNMNKTEVNAIMTIPTATQQLINGLVFYLSIPHLIRLHVLRTNISSFFLFKEKQSRQKQTINWELFSSFKITMAVVDMRSSNDVLSINLSSKMCSICVWTFSSYWQSIALIKPAKQANRLNKQVTWIRLCFSIKNCQQIVARERLFFVDFQFVFVAGY